MIAYVADVTADTEVRVSCTASANTATWTYTASWSATVVVTSWLADLPDLRQRHREESRQAFSDYVARPPRPPQARRRDERDRPRVRARSGC